MLTMTHPPTRTLDSSPMVHTQGHAHDFTSQQQHTGRERETEVGWREREKGMKRERKRY